MSSVTSGAVKNRKDLIAYVAKHGTKGNWKKYINNPVLGGKIWGRVSILQY